MTGKDEWRIIHVGPGGVFTDSLLYGKKKDDKEKTEQQSFITEMQQTGGNQAGANPQAVNLATRQRQSDQPGAPGAPPGDPNNPGNPGNSAPPQFGTPQLDANGQPVPNGSNPNGTPPNAINGPVQVLPDGRIVPVSQGIPQPGNQQAFPAQGQPGANGLPPGVQFPQSGIQGGFPNQQQPGQQQPGQQQPGQPPIGGPPGAAASLINQILTTPRPGGLNGFGGVQPATVDQNGNPVPGANAAGATGGLINPANPVAGNTGTALAPMAGQTIGGGIAGVATKLEQDGIKSYRDRTAYNEWEFVYDITKDTTRGGGAQQQTGTQTQNGAPTSPNTAPAASGSTTPSSTTPAVVTPK